MSAKNEQYNCSLNKNYFINNIVSYKYNTITDTK